MEFLVGAALALLSAVVVAYPFLRARRRELAKDLHHYDTGTTLELESLYRAIADLRWEHQAGELPEDIYRQQLDAFRHQAALLLRQQSQGQGAELVLEQEVLSARRELADHQDGLSSPPGGSQAAEEGCS